MTYIDGYADIIPLEGVFRSATLCAVADSGEVYVDVLRFPAGLSSHHLAAASPLRYTVPREMFGRQYEPLGVEAAGLGHHFDDAAHPPPFALADSSLPLFSPRVDEVYAVLKEGRMPKGFEGLHARLGRPISLARGAAIVALADGTAICKDGRTIFNQHIRPG